MKQLYSLSNNLYINIIKQLNFKYYETIFRYSKH